MPNKARKTPNVRRGNVPRICGVANRAFHNNSAPTASDKTPLISYHKARGVCGENEEERAEDEERVPPLFVERERGV